MKSIYAFACSLLLLGLICLSQEPQAYWQSRQQVNIAATGNNTALDGSAHANVSGASVNASLTTTNATDVIIAYVLQNGCNASMTVSGGGLTWAKRTDNGAGNGVALWYASTSGALTGATINAAGTGCSFITLDVFGISGANTSSPFDVNGALPATTASLATTVSLTTSNANDLLICGYRFAGTASPTQGTGFTKVSGADFMLTQYKKVTATQSGTVCAIGTGDTDENGGIGDAVVSN